MTALLGAARLHSMYKERKGEINTTTIKTPLPVATMFSILHDHCVPKRLHADSNKAMHSSDNSVALENYRANFGKIKSLCWIALRMDVAESCYMIGATSKKISGLFQCLVWVVLLVGLQ